MNTLALYAASQSGKLSATADQNVAENDLGATSDLGDSSSTPATGTTGYQ